MANPSSAGMDHGIAIEGNGVDSDGPIVAPGKTSSVTVSLKKGTYTYYCPVPGHKQAGMKGTLTVQLSVQSLRRIVIGAAALLRGRRRCISRSWSRSSTPCRGSGRCSPPTPSPRPRSRSRSLTTRRRARRRRPARS